MPLQKEELTIFLQHTIRPELAELTERLEKIRHHDIEQIEASKGYLSLAFHLFTGCE
jgi:hypothetical protein